MKKRTRFRDLSAGAQAATAAVIAVSLVVVARAERDLHRRAPDEVRGEKLIWRVACTNALGAVAYFRWGRRAR